jgi:glycerol-3-phosphate acyltransferase PlsY
MKSGVWEFKRMNHIGRKLYHLMGGVGLLSLYYLIGRDRALTFYTVLFVTVLGLDIIRLAIPAVNRFIFKWFSSFIRRNEEHKLTGTAPYILGIGLSLYFYATPIATAAICFLAFGDVAATTIGERYGKIKIGDKSLEGTTAFAVAALCAGLLLMFVGVHLLTWVTILGALVAAGVELLPLRINDNLAIPIVSGGVMELAVRMAR